MKKFRAWRSSTTRSTRSQTQKRKEAALLDRAMNSHNSGTSVLKPEVLWVFINDFTDSDNHAAALVWAKFLVKHPNLKGIYIAEPRHVDLGYYTTSEEFGLIISLVDRLRPKPPGNDEPIKTVLAGKLTQDDIDNSTIDGKPLTDVERNLLQRCIKPDKNKQELKVAKEDAVRHAKLLVMDFLSTMKADAHATFDTYIDHKCLDGALERPINLKTHYHEELVFRNEKELTKFLNVTKADISLEEKAKQLRDWYDESIERKLNDFENKQEPWRDLKDYRPLFDEMRQYERVIVFGGCSLSILQKLLEQRDDSLSKKVEYYQQGGTFNPNLNILGNPLNFALNLDAANYVFEHAHELSKFRLIPTDTTKKLEYTLEGLTKWSPAIGLHSLGFYGKVDLWELITTEEKQNPLASTQEIIRWRSNLVFDDKYSSPKFRAHKVVMADLSAYLISFTDAFKEYNTSHGVVRSRESGVISIADGKKMKLKPDESSPIKALLLDLPEDLNIVLVEDTLALINDTIQTGSSSFKNSAGAGDENTT